MSAVPSIAAVIPAEEPLDVTSIFTSGFSAVYSSTKTSINGVTDVDPTTEIEPD